MLTATPMRHPDKKGGIPMMGEILHVLESLQGISRTGETVDLGRFKAGSIFPVVAVTNDGVTCEAGNGTRFTLRHEDVVLKP